MDSTNKPPRRASIAEGIAPSGLFAGFFSSTPSQESNVVVERTYDPNKGGSNSGHSGSFIVDGSDRVIPYAVSDHILWDTNGDAFGLPTPRMRNTVGVNDSKIRESIYALKGQYVSMSYRLSAARARPVTIDIKNNDSMVQKIFQHFNASNERLGNTSNSSSIRITCDESNKKYSLTGNGGDGMEQVSMNNTGPLAAAVASRFQDIDLSASLIPKNGEFTGVIKDIKQYKVDSLNPSIITRADIFVENHNVNQPGIVTPDQPAMLYYHRRDGQGQELRLEQLQELRRTGKPFSFTVKDGLLHAPTVRAKSRRFSMISPISPRIGDGEGSSSYNFSSPRDRVDLGR